MACGACKKKSTKNTGGEVEQKETSSILRKIVSAILALLVGIIALPVVFIILVSGLYQGWAGDGFDLTKMINLLKKKSTQEEVKEEEINPEDYELVGVDKIK